MSTHTRKLSHDPFHHGVGPVPGCKANTRDWTWAMHVVIRGSDDHTENLDRLTGLWYMTDTSYHTCLRFIPHVIQSDFETILHYIYLADAYVQSDLQ